MRSLPWTSSLACAWRGSRAAGSARVALSLLAALGTLQGAIWVLGLPEGAGPADFAWRGVVLFVVQLAAVAVAWNRRDRATLFLIVGFGVVFRVAAWTWPPDLSTDLYRYVWDGRVQASGQSPYLAPPDAPELAFLRDDAVWPHINRPHAVTVYPPGAQAAFLALTVAGGGSVTGVKTAALGAELVALALVAAALRRRRLPVGRIALYAWSPLVISEICVSGHVDALALPLIMSALLLADAKRPAWAGAVIGAATLVKLYPLLLLAALPRATWRIAVPAAAAVVVAGYAPYLALSGTSVLGFLPDYFRVGEDFNLGLRGFLENGLEPVLPHARHVTMALCGAGLVGVVGHLALGRNADPLETARSIALAFLLLLPTAIHPWYGVWLVPLLALYPSASGIWLVGALPLSYLKYGAPGREMPAWVLWVEWLPAYAFLLAGWLRRRAAQRATT